MKSANPRSGEIPWNTLLLSGFACKRKQTANIKQLTVDMNPDKNELNGNVPTKTQYTNCVMPVNKMYSK